MPIYKCRNCGKIKLEKLFSLGNLSFTGKFPKKTTTKIPKAKIQLVKCKSCNLVQLDRNFNENYLYGKDYGYRTGINQTMTHHVKKIVKILISKTKIKRGDFVLDIASNDATLLNFYPRKYITVGIDPLTKKYKNFYKKINYRISDFFSLKKLNNLKIKKKFKIITALAVFYDLKKPNKFLKDVFKILDEERGIFLLEFTDLLSIIKKNLFDTICHEHIEYYSTSVIINMIKKNNLRVFDIDINNINGGSTRFFICHKNAHYKTNVHKINFILKKENKMNLQKKSSYLKFYNNILLLRKKLKNILNNLTAEKKIIHGYGASTKGNVILQYYNLDNKVIKMIADRNPLKNNCYTPGNKIKIVSESFSRKFNPDYYLVLPWHFKKEILIREIKIRKKGTKFIFPLPKIQVI